MINFEYRLLKVLKFFKKSIANNKSSIVIFVNKILLEKPVNNKKQVVKKNTNEFKYEGDTRTKKSKTKLRMMMTMVDLTIMVMMMRMR